MKIVINDKEFALQPNESGELVLVYWWKGTNRTLGRYLPARLTDIPITLKAEVKHD